MKCKSYDRDILRNILLITVLIIIKCVPSTIQAQHYVGAVVDGETAWHLYREDNATLNHNSLAQPQIGAAFSLGGVYQFQYDKFLLQTGLMASEIWVRHRIDTLLIEEKLQDSEGYDFIYRGQVYDRVDYALLSEVGIPLMLGVQMNSVYLLMGAKCALTVYGLSFQKALLTTTSDSEPKQIEAKDVLIMRPDIRLCMELGWTYALTKQNVKSNAPKLQIGAYLEYGVANPLKNSSMQEVEPLVSANYTPHMEVDMNPVALALPREFSALNNLRVGIRVAVLFPVAKGKNLMGRFMF